MEFAVEHTLRYHYSEPVYLEPQVIYLTPRPNSHQKIKTYRLSISPKPSLLAHNIDAENNLQNIAHFSELISLLEVKCCFNIFSPPVNPFDFLIYPFENQTIPFDYEAKTRKILSPYLRKHEEEIPIEKYKQAVLQNSNSLIDFINRLIEKISTEFTYAHREEGKAMSPGTLLNLGTGTCRDYSNFCMEVCRRCGIAARFVSGYFHGDPEQDRHLHGWVEVFLPGAGWRGIDPTQGIWIDEKYVALAASAYPDHVPPVLGTFRGSAKARMEVKVGIEEAS